MGGDINGLNGVNGLNGFYGGNGGDEVLAFAEEVEGFVDF